MRWRYDIRKDGNQQSFHGNPLLVNDLILIGTDNSCSPGAIGHVYAFDQKTGAVRWKYRTTSASTDIIQVGQRVYFGSFEDNWTALNLLNGTVAWSFSTGASNPDCRLPKSPLTDGPHIYVAARDGNIYSFEAISGKVVWKRQLPGDASTSLVLKDNFLFIGTKDNRIYRLKSESAATDAEIAVEATPVGRPVFSDGSLFFFLENPSERAGYIVSLRPDLKSVRWMQRSSPDWASERPHASRGLIIAGNCRGELAAFRASDGAPQWKLNLKGCIRSIGDSGDTLFAGAQEGTVYALR